MSAVALLAGLVVAAVAAAGVVMPFRRRTTSLLDRVPDPLEDERDTLLRSLRDLDEERATGAIEETDYRALRTETEARAVTVLRSLAARDGRAELAPGIRELRPASPNGKPRRGSALPAIAVVAAALAAGVPVLSSAIRDRGPGSSITGNDFSQGQDSLAFFEARVNRNPTDVAARLDLAERYKDAGDLTGATSEYLTALRLNGNNAEANANLGYLLYLSGDPAGGLKLAERALSADPNYPEGLYVKGVILARGLHRRNEAVRALRAYLAAAPFGSHRDEVLRLLR